MGAIKAGKLDRRVVLLRRDVTRNTFGEEVEGWTPVVTVWARFEPDEAAVSSEAFSDSAEQRSARQSAKFTIRYRGGVVPTMRLEFDGRQWEISDVQELLAGGGGRHEGLVLTAWARDVEPGAGGGG